MGIKSKIIHRRNWVRNFVLEVRKFVFEVRKMDAEVRKSPRGVRSGKSIPKKKENRMNEKITGKKNSGPCAASRSRTQQFAEADCWH